MLEKVGGHRSADELVLALRRSGYHHARTTVYNALDDLARAGLVRAAPVDAGALHYESAGPPHHHFVCRSCGVIVNVPVADDLASRPLPEVEGGVAEELDVVYRGACEACAAEANGPAGAKGEERSRAGSEGRPGAHGSRGANGSEEGHGNGSDRGMSTVSGGANVAMSGGQERSEGVPGGDAGSPTGGVSHRSKDLRPA
jgi:Fe2+ or Zn2+ uptake regulation protein